MVLQLGVCANATGIQDEPRSPTEFALDQVADVIAEDASCPWASETVIDSTTVLYNMQREPNGYIFKLKTGTNDCRYIQIHDYDGIYDFTAIPIAEKVRCRIWRSIGGDGLERSKIYLFSECI